MNPAIKQVLFLSLLISGSTLAGCLADAEACWEVPWPEDGFSGTYGSENQSTPWTIQETQVRRGDGHVMDALALNVSNGAWVNYYSAATGNMLAAWNPGHDYFVNGGMWPVNLWGRCLSTGDRITLPYSDGAHALDLVVVSTSPDLIVEKTSVGAGHPRQTAPPPATIRMIWTEHAPFPTDRIQIGAPQDQKPLAFRMLHQEGPTNLRPALADEVIPLAIHPTTDETPCWERPLRHPDFAALPAHAAFEDYVGNMSKDESLGNFLADHPRACAVSVNYEIVEENSSTAYVWTSIFADQTGDGFRKRWTIRCYHEEHLVLLYGECRERPYYKQTDLLGPFAGLTVNTSAVASALHLDKTLENMDRLTSRVDFTRFTWRFLESADSTALHPRPTAAHAPGFEFDFGTLEGEVRYVGSRGEEPYETAWESDLTYWFPNGWAFMVNDLRPVEGQDP